MVGGVFPPPKLTQYPGHAGGKGVPVSPSSSPRVPDIPQPGSSAVHPRSRRPSFMSTVTRQGLWLPNSVYPPLPFHAESACDPPATQAPYPPRTTCTGPDPSADPAIKGPLPSSVSRTPPLTVSLMPGMGSRPFQLSSRH